MEAVFAAVENGINFIDVSPYYGHYKAETVLGKALKEIGYDQYVVMEPFERMGGQVGKDISIWRDLSNGASDAQLDTSAANSVAYLRSLWG